MAWTIIWEIRLPRALAALILGGALALSGYLLQTFFHNPIAGPFVLGISSGSKLLVALVMVGFLEWNITINSGMLVAAAFAGALLSMLFVLLVARKMEQMAMLIVGGVPLYDVLEAIKEKEKSAQASIDPKKATPEQLREYLAEVLPNFDRERVYVADIKKLVAWYNILISNGITEFKPEGEVKEEAAAE